VRLLTCHCCQAVRHLLQFKESREAFRVVEAYSQGDATEADLAAAIPAAEAGWDAAAAAMRAVPDREARRQAAAVKAAAEAVFFALGGKPGHRWVLDQQAGSAGQVLRAVHGAVVCEAEYGAASGAAGGAEVRRQRWLLHDLFGNPFRPVVFAPAWRTGAAVRLAAAARSGGAAGVLPALADVLQGAGCEDEQLLSHCRAQVPHVRGCWAADLVLGLD
jgi:hypothetical protein